MKVCLGLKRLLLVYSEIERIKNDSSLQHLIKE